jgi:hypothetical protein
MKKAGKETATLIIPFPASICKIAKPQVDLAYLLDA